MIFLSILSDDISESPPYETVITSRQIVDSIQYVTSNKQPQFSSWILVAAIITLIQKIFHGLSYSAQRRTGAIEKPLTNVRYIARAIYGIYGYERSVLTVQQKPL